jgi:hypothetical protein
MARMEGGVVGFIESEGKRRQDVVGWCMAVVLYPYMHVL